jgi:hypothetical protein
MVPGSYFLNFADLPASVIWLKTGRRMGIVSGLDLRLTFQNRSARHVGKVVRFLATV